MPADCQPELFAPAPVPRYRISTWHGSPAGVADGTASAVGVPGVCGCPDPDCKGGWHEDYGGLRLWELRRYLRHLYGCGWSDVTVLVEREGGRP